MPQIFTDKYYDHFSKKIFHEAPVFANHENYMMRFNTHMESYNYTNNNLTLIYFNKGYGRIEWTNKRQIINNDVFIVANPCTTGWRYINQINKRIDVLSLVVSETLKKQFDTFYFSNKNVLDYPFESSNKTSFFIEKALRAEYYPCGRLLKQIHRQSFETDFNFLDAEEIAITVLNSFHNNQLTAYRFADGIAAKKQSTKIETLKRLLIAREYIHDNLNKKIVLDELSDISCLSKFHLYNSFKSVFGKTPHQYANYTKLQRAKVLLMTNRHSVTEVSSILGFNDIHSFSKLFKKAYKISPSKLILTVN